MKRFFVNFYEHTGFFLLAFISLNVGLYSYLSDDTILEKIFYSFISVICYILIKDLFKIYIGEGINSSLLGISFDFRESTSEDLNKIYDYTYKKMIDVLEKCEETLMYTVLIIDLTSIIKHKNFIVISAVGTIIAIFAGKLYDD